MGLWSAGENAALPLPEKVARTVQAWRGAEPRLLIFDNCEAPALLAAWRPAGGGARVLVTSRSGDWPAGFAALAVPTLPRAQSVSLLSEYVDAPSVGAGLKPAPTDAAALRGDADLARVAAELGDLPLALTLAGSYLADSPSVSVDRYLDDLRRVGPLDHLRPREGATAHSWTTHDLDVARTFQISLDGLEPAARPADAAARLMLAGATCLVPGEPFPWALAAGMVEAGDDDDAQLPDAAVRRLLALGLLERTGGGRLRLHRLVAAFAARAFAVRELECRRPGASRYPRQPEQPRRRDAGAGEKRGGRDRTPRRARRAGARARPGASRYARQPEQPRHRAVGAGEKCGGRGGAPRCARPAGARARPGASRYARPEPEQPRRRCCRGKTRRRRPNTAPCSPCGSACWGRSIPIPSPAGTTSPTRWGHRGKTRRRRRSTAPCSPCRSACSARSIPRSTPIRRLAYGNLGSLVAAVTRAYLPEASGTTATKALAHLRRRDWV